MTATAHHDTTGGDMLTAKQTADLLGVPVATLYRWRSTGQPHSGPPGYRGPGRYLRFRRSDVDAWLDKHHEQSDSR